VTKTVWGTKSSALVVHSAVVSYPRSFSACLLSLGRLGTLKEVVLTVQGAYGTVVSTLERNEKIIMKQNKLVSLQNKDADALTFDASAKPTIH
jgi:hypothetical protein